jgi:hypothetical protein
MLRVVALVAGLTTALPAVAGEMSASEARQFVVEKLFSYACFDGTRGLAASMPMVRWMARSNLEVQDWCDTARYRTVHCG